MTNPSKQRGTTAETAVLKYLKAAGYVSAYRKVLAGSSDQGDIQVSPWCIAEVKAHKTVTDGDLERWLVETETEQRNAGADQAILVVVRYRKAVGKAWVVQRDGDGFLFFGYLEDWCNRGKHDVGRGSETSIRPGVPETETGRETQPDPSPTHQQPPAELG